MLKTPCFLLNVTTGCREKEGAKSCIHKSNFHLALIGEQDFLGRVLTKGQQRKFTLQIHNEKFHSDCVALVCSLVVYDAWGIFLFAGKDFVQKNKGVSRLRSFV